MQPAQENRASEALARVHAHAFEEAYVKARYSLEWSISREDLEVLAQRVVVLRQRTQAVCEAQRP